MFSFIYLAAPGLSCGTQALTYGMWALTCGMWDLVPGTGIEPRPPNLGAESLNLWTTEEVARSEVLTCTTI